MSRITEWKLEVLETILKDVQGMSKIIVVQLLTTLKIGQLVLLQKVVADKTATKNLLEVIKVANSAEADFSKLEKSIKGKGFTQAESLVNFAVQLKPDARMMAESLLADEQGLKLLKQGIDALMENYLYVR